MSRTIASATERQTRIAGWEQSVLEQLHVGVVARNWIATFAVWALLCLGVKRLTWLGKSAEATESIDRWLVDKFGIGNIVECPFDPEEERQLTVPLGSCGLILSCSESAGVAEVSRKYAQHRNIPWVGSRLAAGGQVWWTLCQSGHVEEVPEGSNVVVAGMATAALASEYVVSQTAYREGLEPSEGSVGLPRTPSGNRIKRIILVGAGGVGSVAAVGLLAACEGQGVELHVVDDDMVEHSNRNRQFFTHEDASEQRPKADALRLHLSEIFPLAKISSEVTRVGPSNSAVPWIPDAIVSAVDNAVTRLVLQELAYELGCPLVQGATSVHGAEARVQLANGQKLDEQMLGALSDACERECVPRTGSCGEPSYVTPSLLAGAFVVTQVLRLPNVGSTLAWRAGGQVIERESIS